MSAIIQPGASLIRAAQPLSTPHRVEGKYPFQWLYPGPNSRLARPSGIVAVPQIVAPATSATVIVLSYEVPEGFRLALTHILMSTNATGYNPGLGELNFSLKVSQSTAPRNVEFLSSLDYPTGKFSTVTGGFETELAPLIGRLEFGPLETLQVVVVNSGLTTPSQGDVLIAILQGFTYPDSENK